MPTATATRERLTSATITLHHPLDYYFNVFLRAKETEGLKSRTLNDHKNHYRYLQRWLTERYPTLKLDELTADHVRQYVQHTLTEEVSTLLTVRSCSYGSFSFWLSIVALLKACYDSRLLKNGRIWLNNYPVSSLVVARDVDYVCAKATYPKVNPM